MLDGYGFRKGCDEGLIAREVYERVQALLAERRSREPGRARPSIPWPLLGLVRCGNCGRPLSTHTIRRGSVIYRYYRCRSTAGGRERCKGVLVGAHEIESAVLQAAGIEHAGITSKEEEAALHDALQQVVFEADTGRIEMLFRPAGMGPALKRRAKSGHGVTEGCCHIVPRGFNVTSWRRFARTRRMASNTTSKSLATSSARKRRTR